MSTEATLTLIFAGAVAISTFVYAALTWALVAETRRMRRVQTDPKVTVSVIPSPWAFGFADLLLKNQGAGPATDVTFEIVETKRGAGDPEILASLNSFGFIKTGLPHMAAGWEHQTYVAKIIGRGDDQLSTHVHLRVNYRSTTGERHSDCYPVDLTQFRNRMRIGSPPADQIVEELRHMRELLEGIAQTLLLRRE